MNCINFVVNWHCYAFAGEKKYENELKKTKIKHFRVILFTFYYP